MAETIVLSLNSGSSSLKLGLYSFVGQESKVIASGAVEAIGANREGRIWLRRNGEYLHDEKKTFANSSEAVKALIAAVKQNNFPKPAAVGHRIVHGGPDLVCHRIITNEVMQKLQHACDFAPVHIPAALEVIGISIDHFPVPQVACFDTAFHQTLPEKAARFPLPEEFWVEGIRRYGFHGLSCESIVSALGSELAERTVIAHLGNGCSVTAVRGGKSVETTMGLTPTGGVMMATRSGDLDPGLLFYLLRTRKYEVKQLEELLDHRSGLVGVSGVSGDMRTLVESSAQDPKAALAIEMFCYSVRKAIGAMAAVLGGIELLVFTGGIGEHASPARMGICQELGYMGITLDPELNEQNAPVVSKAGTKCLVRVMLSEEDLQIATHTVRLISASI